MRKDVNHLVLQHQNSLETNSKIMSDSNSVLSYHSH